MVIITLVYSVLHPFLVNNSIKISRGRWRGREKVKIPRYTKSEVCRKKTDCYKPYVVTDFSHKSKDKLDCSFCLTDQNDTVTYSIVDFFMWQLTVKTYSCFCILPPSSLHLGLFPIRLMTPKGAHVCTQRRDESQKHPNKVRAQ